MVGGNVCYRGGLSRLLRHLGVAEIHVVDESDALAQAMRIVNVHVEGDCGFFQEFMKRVRSRVAAKGGVTLETLLGAFVADARRCNVRLMWSEVYVEVGDSASGRVFRVTARGAPVEVLLLVKSMCGRRAAEQPL